MSKPSVKSAQLAPVAGGMERSLLDLLPACVIAARFDGTLLYVNQRARAEFNLETGRNILDSCENPEQGRAMLEAVRQKGHLDRQEISLRKADGSHAKLLGSSRTFEFEGEEAVLSSLTDFTIQGQAQQQINPAVDDITDRKKADAAFQENEARFHAMFKKHGAIMFLIEPDTGQILDANAAAQNFYGYSIETLKQMKIEDINILPPREVAERRAQAARGNLNYFVFPHRLASGEVRTVEVHSSPISLGGKSILFSIIHDITERKKAEERLARHDERMGILQMMESAITSSLDLNYILDMLAKETVKQLHVDACAVLFLNQQTDQLELASKDGFHTNALNFTRLNIGIGLAGQAAQKRQAVYIPSLRQIAQDNPSLANSILHEGFVSYLGIPLIAKDKLLGVLEIFHRTELTPIEGWFEFLDILANQVAIFIDNARLLETTKQSLKETNALYSINNYLIATIDHELLMANVVELLQKSFDYYYVQIFILDPQSGNFVMRAGSGEIGQKLKDQGYFLSPGEGIVGFTADTGKPFFTNNVDGVISFVRMAYLLVTKSELSVPIKIGGQFMGLLDVHQMPPALLTERDVQLVSAVADQLAVAMQKARLYTDLQEALQHEQAAHAQLIQAEKLTLAGRLLASVSHELNNPIQVIQNALFLLKEEHGISSQGKQDLEIVLSETDRMASLLERLRSTYQPASRDEFQPVQINDLAEDIFALVATHLRHNRISYAYLADPDLPPISGIANQLRQVFLNLVMNAVDAMPDGGHLTLTTQFLPDSDEVLVKVTDTGSGISPEIFPNIFEAFVTDKEHGTGLGLAISYEIILKHRGRIEAENNSERGATFSIWLPAEGKGER